MKRIEIPNGLVTGLYLVVQPTGAKSCALRHRCNGKPSKFTFGRYPGIELSTARDLARSQLLKSAKGEDPALAKRQAKRQPAAEFDTVEILVKHFIDRHAKRHTGSWAATEKLFARHVLPN
ncbi:MAG: DUF4102 domain-containing protein [Rhizobiales bacterium]|nr:DUF4102 domain-containing protein [Hyphomicrobiales bacterium]